MPVGGGEPGIGIRGQAVVGPVLVLLRDRRIDDAGNVAGAPEEKLDRAAEQLRPRMCRLPRRDVVLHGRYETGRRGHLREIHRCAADHQFSGLGEQVAHVHIAQIEGVHLGRHARRIRVPVEQVERERVLAEQVVVDDERPDEVVVAQHVEGAGHVGAFEEAALRHALLEPVDDLLVDEDAEIARLAEVDHGGEERQAADALRMAVGLQPRRETGRERAAQAIADHVQRCFAGGLLDRSHRRERAFGQVVVEGLAGVPLVRIDPRDHEHRQALPDGPADERVALAQVENVVLVDPGRDDQQRRAVDLRRGGFELEQLHQVVLEHHLARGRGHVLAHAERLVVGHADGELALATFQVLEQVLEAGQQVGAAGVQRGLHHFRVGRDEVGRRQGVDVLAGEELHLARGLRIETFDLADGALHVVGGDEVRLLDVVEHHVGLPQIAAEPVVALGWFLDRRRLVAEDSRHGGVPELQVIVPRAHLDLGQMRRIGQHAGAVVAEGLVQAEFVGIAADLHRRRMRDEVGDHFRRLGHDLGQRLLQVFGIDRGDGLIGFGHGVSFGWVVAKFGRSGTHRPCRGSA